MEKLKAIRLSHGHTQEQLAEMLKTTQQTIARWETGKSEPNIAALKDLALIFSTSVDDLLGRNPLSPLGNEGIVTNWYHYFSNSGDGFWGHLGVRVPRAKKSIWYPITLAEANRINRRIAQTTSEMHWIVATTLNNRALIINVATTPQISILDDAADEVADDWELGWDSYQGFSPEIYRGIEEHFFGFDNDESSKEFKQVIADVVKEEDLDESKVFHLLETTKVYYNDGTLKVLRVGDDCSWSTFSAIESEDESLTFNLSDRDSGLDVFVGRQQVCMLDMPLHKMSEAAKRELEALERDEARSIAASTPHGSKANLKDVIKKRRKID